MRKIATLSYCLSIGLACGSCDSEKDASPDAMGAPTETITVVLGPESANVLVFSSETDGSLIDSSQTNSDGKTSLTARDGGMVSFSLDGYQLTTILDVKTAEGVWYQVEPPALVGGQTVTVTAPSVIGGERYQVFTCRDSVFAYEGPLSVDLRLREVCLEPATFSVMAFVSDFDDLMVYAHAKPDSQTGFQDPIPLTWLSDFEELPFTFEYPGLTSCSSGLRFYLRSGSAAPRRIG